MDSGKPALWYYTLQYNHWLNPHGVGFRWTPRDHTAVYDFTIWKDGRRVAAWSGTESMVFDTMLYLAARDDREAGLLEFLGSTGPVPR
jgi:hypothetical protein